MKINYPVDLREGEYNRFERAKSFDPALTDKINEQASQIIKNSNSTQDKKDIATKICGDLYGVSPRGFKLLTGIPKPVRKYVVDAKI